MERPGYGDKNEEYDERREGANVEDGSSVGRGRADSSCGSKECA